MVSYTSLLGVSATITQIFPLYSALQSAKMTVRLHGSISSINACQECVLSGLGAHRMDLISDATELTSNSATYKITGSKFVFANLVPDCKSAYICDITAFEISSSERKEHNPSNKYMNAFDWNNAQLTCFLTLKPTLSILFMECLQESATATYVGRFRITTSISSNRALFVLYESKSGVTLNACKRIAPGAGRLFLVDNDICTRFMSKLPLVESELPINDQLSLMKYMAEGASWSHANMDTAMRSRGGNRYLQTDVSTLMNDIDAALDQPVHCLRPERELLQEIHVPCYKCLVKIFGIVVVATHGHQTYIFYVFTDLKIKKGDLNFCNAECGAIKVLKMKDPTCHLHFFDHFITSPLGDQFVAPVSQQKPRNLYTVPPQMSSGCVWANGAFQGSECLRCLREIQYSSMHELSESTALVSLQPHYLFGDNRRKAEVANCVYYSECARLLFVPNYICYYDTDMKIVTKIENGHSTHEQPASGSLSIETHGLKTLLPDHRNPDTPSYLFDEPLHSALRGADFSAVASVKNSYASADGFSATDVFVIRWTGQSLECAECLALFGEVLLVSSLQYYAFMIKGKHPVGTIPCVDCGVLTVDKVVSLNIYPLRPISSKMIKKMIFTDAN